MKKVKFFAVALVALTMFSCSNENINDTDPLLPGEKAKVTLKIVNSDDKTRAIGDGVSEEAKVNNLLVFFFLDGVDDDHKMLNDKAMVVTPTDLTNIVLGTTTASKSIYVIANTGIPSNEAIKTSIFKNVKTLADLKAIKGDLVKDGALTQTSQNLWMAGSSDVAFEGTVANPRVQLNFVASKIEIVINDQRTNKNLDWGTAGTKTTIQDKNIAVLFGGGEGSFFGTAADKITQSKFYSGLSTNSLTGVTLVDGLKTALAIDETNTTNKIIKNDPYHFYMFAHQSGHALGATATKLPVIVTIQSDKYHTSTDFTSTYYPAHFDLNDVLKGQTPEVFEAGKYYKLTITLKGDVNAGGGGGTTDPEIPVVAADISIEVTPASWIAKPVEKTFN